MKEPQGHVQQPLLLLEARAPHRRLLRLPLLIVTNTLSPAFLHLRLCCVLPPSLPPLRLVLLGGLEAVRHRKVERVELVPPLFLRRRRRRRRRRLLLLLLLLLLLPP